MGSGIAAQVANARIPVTLLDLPSKEGSRNQITENAKEKILKSRPPLLVQKNKIDLISAGNIEDDFNLVVRLFGFDPKIAFLSHSTFGIPITQGTKHIRDAVEILKNKSVDFKFDGEMQPDVALDEEYKELDPFSAIGGNANVLIMPAQHSAAISLKMMKTLGGAKIIGPFLVGLGQPIEIAPLRSSTGDILNLASVAAYSSEVIDYKKN